MRYLKKLISLLLALTMATVLAVTAYAATTNPGSITIQNADNVSVAGKTFNAYKILDVEAYTGSGTGSKVVYLVPNEMKDFYKTRYSLMGDEGDFDAQVAAKIKGEDDQFAFASAALTAAKAAYNQTPTKSVKTGDTVTSVTISGLPLGYYVVEDAGAVTGDAASAPISALILDTTNPSATVTLKADKPTIGKNIDGSGKYNNAAVGDTVSFSVTSQVPDMTGYKKYFFVVKDTLSKGLTFNNDVSITVNGVKLNRAYIKATTDVGGTTVKYYSDKDLTTELSTDVVKNNHFTVSETTDSNGTMVEIVFANFIQYATDTYKGKDIVITYSATVNESAVIGAGGNTNEITLTYSNNPNETSDGTPEDPDKPSPTDPTGTTPKSETRTYVTGITVNKVDPDSQALTGAEFEITGEKTNIVLVTGEVFAEDVDGTYWLLKDGTYTTTDPNNADVDTSKYQDITTKYSKKTETTPIQTTQDVHATAFVNDQGVLKFEGLSAGTYTIKEIRAPAGFNMLNGDIQVTIHWTAPTGSQTDCTWTYNWTFANGDTVTGADNVVTVTNNAGTELPTTGGMGTTVFYVVGSILLVGAGVLLVAKKRMNAGK